LAGLEKAMIRDISVRLDKLMASRGVQVIRGVGRFSESNRIQIGDETIEARHIVIATGSKTRPLPVPGSELMVTSDDVLSDQQRRSDIVFVGGGIIALEFAHVYARAGAKVTILEVASRLLANFDSDAADRIRAESERLGIVVLTNVTIRRIEQFKNRFRVDYQEGKSDASIETEWVVNGAGRIANIDQLDLAAGSVAHDEGRIALDEYLRSTSNHAVYVCGDAVWSSSQLSPIATYEGQIVGRNIVEGPRHTPEYLEEN
jgi:glutathione reductase (NADPH)